MFCRQDLMQNLYEICGFIVKKIFEIWVSEYYYYSMKPVDVMHGQVIFFLSMHVIVAQNSFYCGYNYSVQFVYLMDDICLFSVCSQLNNRDPTKPIKCYQWNSFYDKGCADFFDNMTYPLKPCSMNATMCRKIIQESKYMMYMINSFHRNREVDFQWCYM